MCEKCMQGSGRAQVREQLAVWRMRAGMEGIVLGG